MTTLAIASLGQGCRRSVEKTESASLPLGPPDRTLALAGLEPHAPITIRLATSEGDIHCQLDADRAPNGVSLFVGLATGRARWRDPRSGAVVDRPMYRDLPFFRAIPGVLVQSGCPLGDGTGHPGYRIAAESTPDDARRLAVPGALVLARYQAAPNRVDPNPPPPGLAIGSQFAIALSDMSHLAGQVTVLGACGDLDRVALIATVVAASTRKVTLVSALVEPMGP